MKNTFHSVICLALAVTLSLSSVATAQAKKKKTMQPKPVPVLEFNASGEHRTLTMPQGDVVGYTAYEKLSYVTNVEDSAYQFLNIYVPDGVTGRTPIFLRTYVGGYMASAATQPSAADASGRALKEGYVLVIPGTRGRNSTVADGKTTIYTGRAPRALLDLKAAIRYLRRFSDRFPGDTERIITDGTSAGGAMSALMGATGNNPLYEPLLKQMGAADERDDVWASVCFCPITDLDHADIAYEWLYGCTNDKVRALDDERKAVSQELAAQFAAYVNSLNLRKPDGTPLNAGNYLGYIKSLLIASAQEAKDAGADIPDTIGIRFSESAMGMGMLPPVNGGMTNATKQSAAGNMQPMPRGNRKKEAGDYVVDIDMDTYLNYVASTIALKTPPAFDSKGVAGAAASGENETFGDTTGSSANFTDFSAAKNGTTVSDDVARNVILYNPMNFIGTDDTSVAPHWYIRHGARDRDTAFPVPINLATKLQNSGKDVNFKLPWNRGHSGDYALNELFGWIKTILE